VDPTSINTPTLDKVMAAISGLALLWAIGIFVQII
jgi:hypothetical protein